MSGPGILSDRLAALQIKGWLHSFIDCRQVQGNAARAWPVPDIKTIWDREFELSELTVGRLGPTDITQEESGRMPRYPSKTKPIRPVTGGQSQASNHPLFFSIV